MILQPKSTNNLPETLAATAESNNHGEAIVSAGLNMIPGSENAATVPVTKQQHNQEGDKKAKENDAAATTPRQH